MIKLIIWDLDGTLVNSLQTTFDAFNEGIERYIGRRMSAHEIMSHFGPAEDKVIASIVGEKHSAECYSHVRRLMADRIHQIKPFDGVVETLSHLDDAGYRLAVFTGRGRHGTDVILDHLGLSPRFAGVITGDEVAQPKPHPEGIFKVCMAAGVDPSHAIMVGDSHMDVQAGNAAGIPTVGCLWDEMANRDKLIDARATHLIEHISEMKKLLNVDR